MDQDDRDRQRPSPDALLAAARRDERRVGRLKIFLGAAPGVGKTYAMLQAARARLKDGVDVVAGVVETHGRAETEALLAGLETIPRRRLTYRNQALEEMDLDALLARGPALALVDELAHTNAEGSRHPKRYLDVEELLEAGIDVYTTLNVQHVESLKTVVAQITRVRVRETVPDSILDRADDIEAIDIAPEDLIQRLRDGKVYLPKQAERALRHFFSPGNLTALRELALRRTADRVDAQLLAHMQSNAIQGPWAAGERVLVCVGVGCGASGLVRYAKRMADRLRAPAAAIHVEVTTGSQPNEVWRNQVADAMRLALRLGLEPVSVPSAGRRVVDDILDYAHGNNATQIIVGRTRRSRWFELLRGSVVSDLVRRAGNISVHVIATSDGEDGAMVGTPSALAADPIRLTPYAQATAFVAVALGLAKLIEPVFGLQNVDLVFLTAIVAVAITSGRWPSLFAVVLSTLGYNFFFLPPLYTLTISEPTNVAALFFFTVVAVLVSNLAARVRSQAQLARARNSTTEALYSFSRKLAGCVVLDDVLWATAYQMASMLEARVVLLLPDDGRLTVGAGYPPEDELEEADMAAAQWSFERNQPAGRGADTLPGARRLFAPMRTGRGAVGVVGLDADRTGPLLTPHQRRLFDALLDQGALAVERVRLAGELDRAKREAETDRLRSALLTSISHDLKTPLAGILGSASTLRDLGAALDDATRGELLGSVIDESERLNRFISNLLDMTRLQAGALAPSLTLQDVPELLDAAVRRAEKVIETHRLEIALAPGLPPVRLDPVLFEQILFNLFDNAAKYAPEGSTVRVEADQVEADQIEAGRTGGVVRIRVLDEGPGIPPGDEERIFEKFFRARKGDSVRPGTGLGLAIARGFIEAMGGTICAGYRRDRCGAVLELRLPMESAPQFESSRRPSSVGARTLGRSGGGL